MREEGMLESRWYLATDRSTKLNILSLEDGIQTDLMTPAAEFGGPFVWRKFRGALRNFPL